MKPRARFLRGAKVGEKILLAVVFMVAIAAVVGFGAAFYPIVAWLLGRG